MIKDKPQISSGEIEKNRPRWWPRIFAIPLLIFMTSCGSVNEGVKIPPTTNVIDSTSVAPKEKVDESFENIVEEILVKAAINGTKLEGSRIIRVITVGLPHDANENTNTVLVLTAKMEGADFTIYVVPDFSKAQIVVVDDNPRLEIPLAYTMWVGLNGQITQITNQTVKEQIMSSEGVSYSQPISPKKVTDDPFPEALRDMMVKNPKLVVIPDYQLTEGTWRYEKGVWSHQVSFDAGTNLN